MAQNIYFVKYENDNIKLLNELEQKFGSENNLYRASELSEMKRILQHGTDRAGYDNDRKWDDGVTPYEDVVFGTTSEMIRTAELDSEKSSSFKKIPLIYQTDIPVILIYDLMGFQSIGDRQWLFIRPEDKLSYLKSIIILEK